LNQSQTNYFPKGYRLRTGSGKDRALLVRFMHLTYQELFPQQQNFSHLAKTVERYLSAATASKYLDKSAQTELHGVSLLVN
jgi:hypothetical protein